MRKVDGSKGAGSTMGTYTSAAYTSEFTREFEVETEQILRRRFLWFTAVVVGFGVAVALLWASVLLFATHSSDVLSTLPENGRWKNILVSLLGLLLYACGFAWAYFDKPEGKVLIKVSILLVVADGLLHILGRVIDMPDSLGIFGFGITHLIVVLFLPWSPAQALRPAIYVLGASAIAMLTLEHPLWSMTGSQFFTSGMQILFSPLVVVPGMLVATLRHSQRTQKFKMRFFQTKYGDLRRELVDAKRIHESLFPEPINQGPVVLTYSYEPARAIGGDFLFVHRTPAEPGNPHGGSLTVAVIDVTGHGIPAALTVNRLHGELTRIFAEEPDASPGEVLRLLNRYVHLTLANHSIYATGLCVRINPDGQTLDYASAGHPPAFVRGVNNTIEDLDSTAIVLGAAPADAFESGQRSVQFGPGDAFLAYTDGATEARNASGRMFRIEGLRGALVNSGSVASGGWPAELRRQVEAFRSGAPEDDLLIVEARRSLQETVTKQPTSRVRGGAHAAGS